VPTIVSSAKFLWEILVEQFFAMFLNRQFGFIMNKVSDVGGHFKRKYELSVSMGLAALQFCGERGLLIDLSHCALAITSQKRFLLQPPATPFSAAATSTKMPYWKYASSRLGSLYATKRGYASNSTRSTDHSAKVSISASAKAGFRSVRWEHFRPRNRIIILCSI
jgi:hypothetical protein